MQNGIGKQTLILPLFIFVKSANPKVLYCFFLLMPIFGRRDIVIKRECLNCALPVYTRPITASNTNQKPNCHLVCHCHCCVLEIFGLL